jgi:hypothetical protein
VSPDGLKVHPSEAAELSRIFHIDNLFTKALCNPKRKAKWGFSRLNL